MNSFLKDLPQTPLTPEKEQELFLAGDTETVVLHALVPAFNYTQNARKGASARPSNAEVLSICYAALSRSIKTFKPGMQNFLAYSKPFLRGELCRYWREKGVVRDSFRHETPTDDEFPKPLVDDHIEPVFDHWKELWERVEPTVRSTLSSIEMQVLTWRFKYSLTLEETGEHIRKSRERVRQIEETALKKLRAALPKEINE